MKAPLFALFSHFNFWALWPSCFSLSAWREGEELERRGKFVGLISLNSIFSQAAEAEPARHEMKETPSLSSNCCFQQTLQKIIKNWTLIFSKELSFHKELPHIVVGLAINLSLMSGEEFEKRFSANEAIFPLRFWLANVVHNEFISNLPFSVVCSHSKKSNGRLFRDNSESCACSHYHSSTRLAFSRKVDSCTCVVLKVSNSLSKKRQSLLNISSPQIENVAIFQQAGEIRCVRRLLLDTCTKFYMRSIIQGVSNLLLHQFWCHQYLRL